MKTVLCFGDSNTHGTMPDKSGRFDHATRWPRQLQHLLGGDYLVIEEGKGGRTTIYEDPLKPGNNGMTYFKPCLASHWPLDYIVIMLGTNDWKIRNQKTPKDTAAALQQYIETIKEVAQQRGVTKPKIILVSPITINPEAPLYEEFYTETYNSTSVESAACISPLIQAVAQKNGADFIDAATIATAGKDGVHINLESQSTLAKKVKEHIA